MRRTPKPVLAAFSFQALVQASQSLIFPLTIRRVGACSFQVDGPCKKLFPGDVFGVQSVRS